MILLLSFFKMYGSLIPGYMIGDFKMNMILNFKKEKSNTSYDFNACAI